MNKKSIVWVLGTAMFIAVIPSISVAQVVNLADLNNSFEEVDDFFNGDWGGGWVTWNPAEGDGSTITYDTTEFIDGAQSLRVDAKGTAAWHFEVIYAQVPMTAGQEYTASVWAKAEEPRSFAIQCKAMDNTTTWGTTTFDLTTEWAEYAFTAEALANNNVKVEIHCGGTEIPMWLDFLYVYEGPYVAGIDPSGLSAQVLAIEPNPANGATDVPYYTDLGWEAGEFAATHDVYFGTDWDDVNGASVDNPLGVLAGAGLTETSLVLDSLDFDTPYFWRVDEVNAPPDNTLYQGHVWNFTTEPVAYPIANVTATASSAHDPGNDAVNTVNGSGLDAEDQHSANLAHMWLSNITETEGVWIQYDLGQIYKLHGVHVWNHNSQTEKVLGYGIKEALIETSSDGETWTELKTTEIPQATGTDTDTGADIALDGVIAQHVRITALSNYSILGLTQVGLSEVRFYSIPVLAREPNPSNNGTSDSIDVVLQWRAGREAVEHEVVFGKEEQAVIDNSAVVGNADVSFDVGILDIGTPYFWKINALGDTDYEGDLWSFLTPDHVMIDDFEMYRDQEGLRIWEHWFDGFDNPAENGAVVGDGDNAEKSVVYEGSQSMPVAFNNTTAPKSEVTHFFDTPLDLTQGNPESLKVQVRGDAPSFIEGADGTLTIGAAGADIWNTNDEFRYIYKPLTGDGSIVAKVESLVHANDWTKAGVMIRETLSDTSAYAYVCSSSANGTRYQYRLEEFGAAAADDTLMDGIQQTLPPAPVWLKIERVGNAFNGYYATDENGTNWAPMGDNPLAITMISSVNIGLAVTSHDNDVTTTAVFSNVSTTGTGAWQEVSFGPTHPNNDAAPMYLVLTDTSGKETTIDHPDPAATLLTGWDEWTIPLTDLSGINVTEIDSITVGVGSAGVQGNIFVDAIRTARPYAEPAPTE